MNLNELEFFLGHYIVDIIDGDSARFDLMIGIT